MIYKAHMYKEATLDPERCSYKSDEKARRIWLQTHIRQIDHYEDIASPVRNQQEDDAMEEADADTWHTARKELPPSGSGAQAPTRGTAAATVEGGTAPGVALQPPAPIRLRFGTLEPPTLAVRSGGGTSPANFNTEEQQNRFAPLKQHGSGSGERGSLDLSSGILRGGASSTASSSKGSRGREPVPLTPEILLLLDRLEQDKGKQARLLAEHLTGQRTLPCTEQELHKLLERNTERER